MDIEHYEDHLMELEQVLEEALRRVAARYPQYEDDLYIVGLEVDGQYHKVTVGVANIRDETVTVDSTRLIARGGLASHDEPRPRRYLVHMDYSHREIVAASADEAIGKYLELEVDDKELPARAEEMVEVAGGGWTISVATCPDCGQPLTNLPLGPNGFYWRCENPRHGKKLFADEQVSWETAARTAPRPRRRT